MEVESRGRDLGGGEGRGWVVWGCGGDGSVGFWGGGSRVSGGTEILGIWLILWLIRMVNISSKSEAFQFLGEQNLVLGGLQ